jgi:four helix bundle protein
VSQTLALECYRLTKKFPSDEKFALVQQIRRASISVHLNLAEGCSRKSQKERNRFFEIARGSVVEVDTAIDIAIMLDYISLNDIGSVEDLLVKSFKLLTGMIKNIDTHN